MPSIPSRRALLDSGEGGGNWGLGVEAWETPHVREANEGGGILCGPDILHLTLRNDDVAMEPASLVRAEFKGLLDRMWARVDGV